MTAGTPLGASPAPSFLSPFPSVFSTRTRALHGAVLLGSQFARVWSSKRAGDPLGVIVTFGDGDPLALTGRLSATHARMIAQALFDAALTFERRAGLEGGAA